MVMPSRIFRVDELRARELRKLPQVDRLIETIGAEVPRQEAAEAARAAVDEARAAVTNGAEAPSLDSLADRARLLLHAAARSRLGVVVNATGVLLHTNLGRAPLSRSAGEAMERVSTRYSNLEYDLAAGARGSRYGHATGLLKTLTGAEGALVVNNNAAAVMLVLAAVAADREVVISRGELIEIGGGFRIPEILSASGAVLREVGTTNRTHFADYEKAIGPQTAAIMKVHPSNYRVVGFSSSVESKPLVDLAHHHGVAMIHDLGSGLLHRSIAGAQLEWLREEPSAAEAVGEGADAVTFSGDKLLGGPQAGIILGSNRLIERLHRSPLLRAVRIDKTSLAALEDTLVAYVEGRAGDLPIWSMALVNTEELDERARRITSRLRDERVRAASGYSTIGGGSAPGVELPTALLEVAWPMPNQLVRRLIDNDPPVIARIETERVVLDLRTVFSEQDEVVSSALARALNH
jgi:L-seryl-tRNA(Ser) seleniumtransferase